MHDIKRGMTVMLTLLLALSLFVTTMQTPSAPASSSSSDAPTMFKTATTPCEQSQRTSMQQCSVKNSVSLNTDLTTTLDLYAQSIAILFFLLSLFAIKQAPIDSIDKPPKAFSPV